MTRRSPLLWIGVAALALSACGGDSTAKSNKASGDAAIADTSVPDAGGDASTNNVTPDMRMPDSGSPDMSADMGDDVTINPALCGNGLPNPGEDCDDANADDDDECNSSCRFTCGDGQVGALEQCDTAIAAGLPGACPTACDDQDACTSDTLSGSECLAQCVTGDIAACVDGDGCCPSACDATTDSDCTATCGNGIIEAGETCDGNCPTACDDGAACTTDVMSGSAATCDAACSTSPVVACVNGDGCCPAGCDSTNDDSCSATCGNGTIEPPETCDAACPMNGADCDDNDVCTADTASGLASQCNAMCVNTPLGCRPNLNDGCCPASCNANNDADCTAVCGNSVREAGEQCDDGGTTAGDGCDANCQNETGPAFRMSDLDLMDPHVFINFSGCRDITNGNVPFNLSPPINGMLQDSITQDGNNDGTLDLSFVAIFDPLDQANGAMGNITVAEADCTAPMATTSCTVDSMGSTFQMGTYTTNTAASCLDALPNTTRPYMPAIRPSTAPCFATTAFDLTIDFNGIQVPLTDVQVGATFVGNPATGLENGLLRGFISEADADAVLLPSSLPLVGGDPLSSVLAGGTGACPAHDDRDVGPDGITMGWWFYLNFPAAQVPTTVQ